MKSREKSRSIFERAQKALVGGVNSPVRAFKAVGGLPMIAEQASGARIFDADGQPDQPIEAIAPQLLGRREVLGDGLVVVHFRGKTVERERIANNHSRGQHARVMPRALFVRALHAERQHRPVPGVLTRDGSCIGVIRKRRVKDLAHLRVRGKKRRHMARARRSTRVPFA